MFCNNVKLIIFCLLNSKSDAHYSSVEDYIKEESGALVIPADVVEDSQNEFYVTPEAGDKFGPEVRPVANGVTDIVPIDPDKKQVKNIKPNPDFEKFIKGMFTTTPAPAPTLPPPSGPFYDLLINICNVILTRLSSHKTIEYLKILRSNLKRRGFGYYMRIVVKRLSKTLKKMSRFRGKWVKDVIAKFLQYLKTRMPLKDKFFETMNAIFTSRDDNLFDNYIYDLKRFGDNRIDCIERKTKFLFERVINSRFYDQKEYMQDEIKNLFGLFLYEFLDKRSKGEIFM